MRTFLAALAAGLMACAAIPAAAQDMDALAKSLAANPKPETQPSCPKKLPDGSCPDTVDTRQMRLPGAGGASSAGAAMVRAVRLNINMTFVKGSAELTAAARAKLDSFVKAIASVGSLRPFTVEGHTDSSGPRNVNLALSQARADSVVKYLAANGVDKSKMTAKGFGPDQTLKGHSPEDAANRRVEVSAS